MKEGFKSSSARIVNFKVGKGMIQCWMILLILSSRILVSGCLQLQFYDKLYWLYMKYPEVTRKILSNGQNSSVRVEISKMEIFSDAELFPVIFFLAPCKRLTIIFSIKNPPTKNLFWSYKKLLRNISQLANTR